MGFCILKMQIVMNCLLHSWCRRALPDFAPCQKNTVAVSLLQSELWGDHCADMGYSVQSIRHFPCKGPTCMTRGQRPMTVEPRGLMTLRALNTHKAYGIIFRTASPPCQRMTEGAACCSALSHHPPPPPRDAVKFAECHIARSVTLPLTKYCSMAGKATPCPGLGHGCS